ncbi:hypothetical protein VKT23_008640 [Stygiomarasmius scandens]|uniref:Uncharacterized protein n=1 Tax=Marasmiellus scandens TaxID=2682957 RepID=A0ABR1JJT4_9AGAR
MLKEELEDGAFYTVSVKFSLTSLAVHDIISRNDFYAEHMQRQLMKNDEHLHTMYHEILALHAQVSELRAASTADTTAASRTPSASTSAN